MVRCLLLTLLLFTAIQSSSQVRYQKGYFIDASGRKVECFIKNVDWKNNPIRFDYRFSENSEELKATITSVSEFAIYNEVKFLRATVNIDRSIQELSNLSVKRNPEYQNETLFLRVLVEGNGTVYEFVDKALEYYFFKTAESNIEPLIHKQYLLNSGDVGENNDFRQQLVTALTCRDIKVEEIKSIDYKRKALKNLFIKYNKCDNSQYVDFDQGKRKYSFNMTVRPGLSFSSLGINNTLVSGSHVEFGKKVNFRLGLEQELIFPFNKRKWSMIVESTYQYYEVKQVNKNDHYKTNYHSIELPVGFRHYLFLNDHSKLFVNAQAIFDFAGKSNIDISNKQVTLDISSGLNYGFGIGYKYADRYSIEFRYLTSRHVLHQYFYYQSKYETYSFVIGYSLFKPSGSN